MNAKELVQNILDELNYGYDPEDPDELLNEDDLEHYGLVIDDIKSIPGNWKRSRPINEGDFYGIHDFMPKEYANDVFERLDVGINVYKEYLIFKLKGYSQVPDSYIVYIQE